MLCVQIMSYFWINNSGTIYPSHYSNLYLVFYLSIVGEVLST